MFFTSDLKAYNIHASDGEMGKVKDLYFDDQKWTIRYAVIDSRKWLLGRRVLISPTSFRTLNEREELVEVELDKDTIRNSPTIPEEHAITKDVENSLISYYGWARDWTGNMIWGNIDEPFTSPRSNEQSEIQEQRLHDMQAYDLRSEDETLGYKVHANDGKIGTVIDMVFDTEYWKLRYMVVQDSDTYTEEAYLIYPIDKIETVDWFEEDIYLNETLAEAKTNAVYKSKATILPNL
ncbi:MULTISPECIES: PRC-barrel domain-containing protein [Virgibacillus]|uniref:Photosynthetic reaction center H subunit n=1 Tax=Virgibacillus massiliensis TaxID=1462526 RepID=A0A024QES7_9BACI|nr:PRC-barrel domain-containing protein [Virgibacillus massiliensis]CDQ40762.1 photosynthetic reaction center H subunit [Virgibacillus massiliensis]